MVLQEDTVSVYPSSMSKFQTALDAFLKELEGEKSRSPK